MKDKPVSVKKKLGQIYQKKEAKVSTARVMTKVQKVAKKRTSTGRTMLFKRCEAST